MVTPAGMWDTLLRRTVRDNCWWVAAAAQTAIIIFRHFKVDHFICFFRIYVYNSNYELYIGIKTTGTFQHSSFLYGGRVLSAGLLKAKDGYLTSLSPLSGHYRAGTAHFRFFVASLQDSGVNLEHVTLSKSLLMLRGLEQYGKLNKKMKGGKKEWMLMCRLSDLRTKQRREEKRKEEKDRENFCATIVNFFAHCTLWLGLVSKCLRRRWKM